jgi:hypothetical protein
MFLYLAERGALRSLKQKGYRQGLLALGDCCRPVGEPNYIDLLVGGVLDKSWETPGNKLRKCLKKARSHGKK